MQPASSINITTPPIALVKTWCQLLQGDDKEAKARAKKMLLDVFGDIQNVIGFLTENNIKV